MPASPVEVQGPPEGSIHLDNHSLCVAPGDSERSVFENGTECRSGVFLWGNQRPRKWACSIHIATVARDHSRKEARNGDPIPWCARNGSNECGGGNPPFLIRPHYRQTDLALRKGRCHLNQEAACGKVAMSFSFCCIGRAKISS